MCTPSAKSVSAGTSHVLTNSLNNSCLTLPLRLDGTCRQLRVSCVAGVGVGFGVDFSQQIGSSVGCEFGHVEGKPVCVCNGLVLLSRKGSSDSVQADTFSSVQTEVAFTWARWPASVRSSVSLDNLDKVPMVFAVERICSSS
jgi:hypothetical protein